MAVALCGAWGCFPVQQEPVVGPPAPSMEEQRWQQEHARLEMEAEEICANPPGDRTRELCAERRVRQQMAAEQGERDERAREIQEHQERDRLAEDAYRRKQERAAAIRAAVAPLFAPPSVAPARSCTSMINGDLVTTLCH